MDNSLKKLLALFLLLLPLFLPLSAKAQSFEEGSLPTMEQVYDAVPFMEDSTIDTQDFTINGQENILTEEQLDTMAKVSSLLGGTFLLIFLFSGIVLYVFFGITQQKTAQRLGLEKSWHAWVPILSTIQLFKMGDQNPLLILLSLVPVIGQLALTVLSIMVYCKIAEKLGYDKLFGLLSLVPIGPFIMWGMFAWGEKSITTQTPVTPQNPENLVSAQPTPTILPLAEEQSQIQPTASPVTETTTQPITETTPNIQPTPPSEPTTYTPPTQTPEIPPQI
ncbi:hypothetical protein KBB69_02220 [Candidatus Dojkabacteria bacterium]|mgnify:FL=1|nr:hypothetical protein [Candidatus Dojkabacteria bacterium]